jgi:2-dehydropantoate 2-reductase
MSVPPPAADRIATPGPVLVHGAGAVGLYLGGRLALAGCEVRFIGRPVVVDALRERGLELTGLDGVAQRLAPSQFTAATGLPQGARPPALTLLTVKGPATRTAATELANALPAGSPVVSFQNGVDNLDRLRRAAPSLHAIAGMVPFNVVQAAPGRLRQASSGRLVVQRDPALRDWRGAFAAAGLPLVLHEDMRAVQWGKLLLNLNNPLNALSGLPLLEQLADRRYRVLLATLQDEALAALRAAGIRPARATPLPSRWLPGLLRLPTWLFRRLARRMLTIHPEARLSMHADRVAGRPTEIDDLCGAVLRLAAAHSVEAPANAALQRLVEQAPPGRWYDAAEIEAAIGGNGQRPPKGPAPPL